MIPHLPYFVVNALQTVLGLCVLIVLIRAKQLKTYWPVLVMAVWQAPSFFTLMYVRHLGHQRITPNHAYKLYFFSFWPAYAISALCALWLTRALFNDAMRPLKGLKSLGRIVFLWVVIVSVSIAVSVAFDTSATGSDSLVAVVGQLERLSAIIIVSLIAFVITAIQPLGLTTQSRVFGASVGLIIVAFTNLLQSSRLTGMHQIYSRYGMVQMVSGCISLAIWLYYFAKPEPERNFVMIPTTSPFHYWNDIARRLDQEPGMVAIGGFNPNALTGAEVEVFRRASAKMQTLDEPGKPKEPTGV